MLRPPGKQHPLPQALRVAHEPPAHLSTSCSIFVAANSRLYFWCPSALSKAVPESSPCLTRFLGFGASPGCPLLLCSHRLAGLLPFLFSPLLPPPCISQFRSAHEIVPGAVLGTGDLELMQSRSSQVWRKHLKSA